MRQTLATMLRRAALIGSAAVLLGACSSQMS
jgi:hypothetical protein